MKSDAMHRQEYQRANGGVFGEVVLLHGIQEALCVGFNGESRPNG